MMERPGTNRHRVAMFVLNDMRYDSRVRREADSLARAGYEVTVYAVQTPGAGLAETEVVGRYLIRRFPMPMRSAYQGPDGPKPRGGLRPNVRRSAVRHLAAGAFVATRPLFGGVLHYAANWHLRWGAWRRRVLREVAPADIWHAHDLNTLPLAVRCAERHGGQVVYDSHEIFTEAGATAQLPAPALAYLKFLERRWARGAAAVVTVNQSVAKVIGSALGDRDVAVVHNCATIPPRRRSPLRAALSLADDRPIVLFHGSLSPGRGLRTLVEAFDDERLGDARLVFMGYGVLRPEIQALAANARAAKRIYFIPPVPPADVTRWVAGSDVVAMPLEPLTLNLRLATPNKLWEAIAAGVPVVGPDFEQFRRIVHGGPHGRLGVLFSEHSPGAIASAMHELLVMPRDERQAIRARCRRAAASRWNWSAEARTLIGLYANLPAARAEAAAPASAASSSRPMASG